MSTAPFRGRVQAQGDDIRQDGGYSESWAQDIPVTDQQGLDFLDKIERKCNESQKRERKQAFIKAKNFVERASELGGVDAYLTRSFKDRKRSVSNARVDIEVHDGLTFIPVEQTK